MLRFLGGCQGNELTEFIELLTLPFREILEEKNSMWWCFLFICLFVCLFCDAAGDDGGGVAEPGRVVPLKKQQGFLNMVGLMVENLGPKLLPHLPTILRIVTHLGMASGRLLDQRQLASRT